MKDTKYAVPDGMILAVVHRVHDECGTVHYHPQIRTALEAAVLWLSENPIVPNPDQISDIGSCVQHKLGGAVVGYADFVEEWQRRMFLAPWAEDDSDGRLQGMEEAAKLFDGLSFGPYYHPSQKIRDRIEELRSVRKAGAK
jgi:hypothetical protein